MVKMICEPRRCKADHYKHISGAERSPRWGEPQTPRHRKERPSPVLAFAIGCQIPEIAKTCRMLCADGNS